MSQKNNIKIKKVLVVGLGLIGASLCRDLKKNSNYEKIYGHDTDAVAMEYAINKNYVPETRTVSFTHLRAQENKANLVCRLLLGKKKSKIPCDNVHID